MAKILAVDDEPAILEMIESILNKDGHLVTKVSNPLKLNMEELHRYDLILLDIMMPGIDGFELCKRIRALVDCPILFLTAKTEENSLVINLEPFNGELRLLKTKIYLAFNRFEQALESLDEMEKVLPDSFDIYDVKSQILLGQERYTERLLKSTSN